MAWGSIGDRAGGRKLDLKKNKGLEHVKKLLEFTLLLSNVQLDVPNLNDRFGQKSNIYQKMNRIPKY